jgi:hypothetical protein
MRICLISSNSATFQLALGLKNFGHDVEVIALATSDDQHAQQTNQSSIVSHYVTESNSQTELGVVPVCMPNSKYLFSVADALWKKLAELHKEKPFDVVDVPDYVLAGLMPGMTREIPFVLRLSNKLPKYVASNMHPITYPFDMQFPTLLRSVSLTMADQVIAPNQMWSGHLQQHLGLAPERIAVINETLSPQESAQLSVSTYENAKQIFAERSASPLYRKGNEQMIIDSQSMYLLWDKMLYDAFFVQSYSFRIRHWFRKLVNTPQGNLQTLIGTIIAKTINPKWYQRVV